MFRAKRRFSQVTDFSWVDNTHFVRTYVRTYVLQDERKTRTAYKDKMKREAFDLINHIAGNCDLHETVTVRAKELFAGWRNVK